MHGKENDRNALDALDGSVDACVAMTKKFVQKVIDNINDRFLDMHFFNATKLDKDRVNFNNAYT